MKTVENGVYKHTHTQRTSRSIGLSIYSFGSLKDLITKIKPFKRKEREREKEQKESAHEWDKSSKDARMWKGTFIQWKVVDLHLSILVWVVCVLARSLNVVDFVWLLPAFSIFDYFSSRTKSYARMLFISFSFSRSLHISLFSCNRRRLHFFDIHVYLI